MKLGPLTLRRGSVVLGLLLALVTVSSAMAAPPKPKNKKARAKFDQAVSLYQAGDFDAAAKAAKRGYEIEAQESLLYIWGQAERRRGNCVRAIELYEDFIEIAGSDKARENGRKRKAECEDDLEREAAEAAAAGGSAEEIEPLEEYDDEDPRGELDEPPVTLPPARPWYRDPLGGALVGVGGVAILTGGAVLVAAAVLDPEEATDYGTFDRRRRVRPRLFLAGGITAGLGALIGAAGGVRWGLLARDAKANSTARVNVSPWLDPARAGIVVRGRF
ncbi:MAG: hypothetical protein K0V04_35725 [Deltaproteobacteria bacterium]|nr:hypothetical protein [Deltaproteobacteria bacterium]